MHYTVQEEIAERLKMARDSAPDDGARREIIGAIVLAQSLAVNLGMETTNAERHVVDHAFSLADAHARGLESDAEAERAYLSAVKEFRSHLDIVRGEFSDLAEKIGAAHEIVWRWLKESSEAKTPSDFAGHWRLSDLSFALAEVNRAREEFEARPVVHRLGEIPDDEVFNPAET